MRVALPLVNPYLRKARRQGCKTTGPRHPWISTPGGEPSCAVPPRSRSVTCPSFRSVSAAFTSSGVHTRGAFRTSQRTLHGAKCTALPQEKFRPHFDDTRSKAVAHRDEGTRALARIVREEGGKEPPRLLRGGSGRGATFRRLQQEGSHEGSPQAPIGAKGSGRITPARDDRCCTAGPSSRATPRRVVGSCALERARKPVAHAIHHNRSISNDFFMPWHKQTLENAPSKR